MSCLSNGLMVSAVVDADDVPLFFRRLLKTGSIGMLIKNMTGSVKNKIWVFTGLSLSSLYIMI